MSQAQRHFCLVSSRPKTHLSPEPAVCGLCSGLSQTPSEFSSNPQPKLPPPPQILRVGKHPQHAGNAQVVPAPSVPCSLVSSSGRTWVVRGDGFFIDGCGCLEICLPTPFDAPTHLLTPSPLLTPPQSSAPSFPPPWHFSLPRTRFGLWKNAQILRGAVGCGLVWSPRCTEGAPAQQPPWRAHPTAEPSFEDVAEILHVRKGHVVTVTRVSDTLTTALLLPENGTSPGAVSQKDRKPKAPEVISRENTVQEPHV